MAKKETDSTPTQSTPPPPATAPDQTQVQESVNKIENLASDAAGIDGAKQLFEPEKKRRGPRGPYKKTRERVAGSDAPPSQNEPGSAEAPAAKQISSDEIVRPTVDVVDAWVTKIAKNPKAAMQKEEKDGICKSFGLLLDKYAPTVVEKYAVEMMAIMALSAYGTRVYAIVKTDADNRKKEYEEKVRAQQRAAPKDVTPQQPADPNPSANGKDHNPPPPPTGPKYGNAFAGLAKH